MVWYGMVWYGLVLVGAQCSSSAEERSSSSCLLGAPRGGGGGGGGGEGRGGGGIVGGTSEASEASEAAGAGAAEAAGREWGSVAARGIAVDSSSEASSDGKAKGHPDHRGQSGRSPRRVITSNTTLQSRYTGLRRTSAVQAVQARTGATLKMRRTSVFEPWYLGTRE